MKRILLLFLSLQISLTAQIKVGLLDINNAVQKNSEVTAVFDFLHDQKSFSVEKINYNNIVNSNFSIRNPQFSVIWIHRPDSTELTKDETDPRFILALKNYVKNGGNLFLTLDAVKYLNALGLETAVPTAKYVEAIDDGYGRKLGLHSFMSHPIFNGLNGGAYIFNPTRDMKTRQIGFFGESFPQNGKVAAVDWAYITLKEDSRLVVEYQFGKGKILAVGAYTYYSIENNNRAHLEMFTKNCLNYLVGKYDKEKKHYWNYRQSQVLFSEMKTKPIIIPKTKEWKKIFGSMKLINGAASENFWNVAGQRMLVMGKEKAGIDEIWAHPFMALRDYEVGIVKDDSVSWLKNFSAKVEVKPESFSREYKIDNSKLTEIITTSVTKPVTVVHYELHGNIPLKLVIKFKSNLRYMWPYSEKTTGSIYYNWNNAINAFVVKNESEDVVNIVGSDKRPSRQNIGQFENFDSHFKGILTDKSQIGAYSQFNLEANDNLDIVIAASNEGIRKTIDEYNAAVTDPEKIYISAADYSKKFFNNSLIITTPDKDFNEGYKWALIGTDRFFVDTPDLGRSLVAGYSTTACGWDGGHKINGRPGYGWYFGRDGCWSGFALLDYGDFEKVKSMLEFFNKYQDLSGKIFHELTTSGAVHYDASDSTPLYIILAGKYLHHTGDVEFIKKNWIYIKKAIDFCYSTDTDKDHLIENTNVGHGWVEGGGLYTAHTEVYLAACWAEALRQASYMAKQVGKSAERKAYKDEYQIVKNIIDKDFWNEQENFLSFSKLKDGKYNSEKTVLAAVPLYFGTVESSKAKKVADAYSENYFSSDWGVRILREDSPIFNPRGYHTGSVWPLFTGWAALAEYKNENYVQGFSHIMNNLLVYKNWQLGFVEEVLNGAEYKPGGVCPHQCWSETMVLQPTIEGMLGLEINAVNNKIKFSPHFPADWNSIKVEKIKIGNAVVNFIMKREKEKIIYNFSTSALQLINIEFSPSFPMGTKFKSATINERPFTMELFNNRAIDIPLTFHKSSTIEIEYTGGISVLPNVTEPNPNDISKGFRILNDKLEGGIYSVEVQGISGSRNEMKIYSADKSIKSVENGNIITEQNSIYTISVEFEKSNKKYINKTVRVIL